MKNSIFQELKKLGYFPYVVLAEVCIILLCFCSEGSIGNYGESCSIIAMMLDSTGRFGNEIEESSFLLWKKGMGTWLMLFLPFIVTIAYITVSTSERKSHALRTQIIREGKLNYVVSKVISGFIYGGGILVIAYMVFGFFMITAFPSFTAFDQESQQFYLGVYGYNSLIEAVVKQLFGVFLYGGFSAVFGIAVTIFSEDRYILLCIPFMLSYMWNQVITRIMLDIYATGNDVGWVSSLQISNIVNVGLNQQWLLTAGLMIVIYTIIIIVFYIFLKKGWYDV